MQKVTIRDGTVCRSRKAVKRYRVYCIQSGKINSAMPPETRYEDYMRVSLAILAGCDAIYLLDGWENSRGASLEAAYARTMGLAIYTEGDLKDWHKTGD